MTSSQFFFGLAATLVGMLITGLATVLSFISGNPYGVIAGFTAMVVGYIINLIAENNVAYDGVLRMTSRGLFVMGLLALVSWVAAVVAIVGSVL